MKKGDAQFMHAIQRGWVRHRLSMADVVTVKQMIQAGGSRHVTFVERQSLRVSVFDVEFKGSTYRVVYDKKQSEVVTFLPEEARR